MKYQEWRAKMFENPEFAREWKRLRFRFFVENLILRIRIRWWNEKIVPRLPRIPRRKPSPPVCDICGSPYSRIVAVGTGDGWAFYWEHDEPLWTECGNMSEDIEDWYPFYLGAWCNKVQLERIGIRVQY